MSTGYELNEKDIDSVLNYLKIFHPNIATPEMAITILESMFIKAHKAAHGENINIEDAIEQAIKDMDEKNLKG